MKTNFNTFAVLRGLFCSDKLYDFELIKIGKNKKRLEKDKAIFDIVVPIEYTIENEEIFKALYK